MTSCYKLHQVALNASSNAWLCRLIDAVYVLTVDDSERIHDCLHRLRRTPLLDKAYVQSNRTFCSCFKEGVSTPDQDLRHAMSQCMRTALARGHKRIVTMEDDCEIVSDCDTMRESVLQFYSMPDYDALQFGSIPMLSTIREGMIRIHMGGATHAIAWTERGMRRFLDRISAYNGRDFVDVLMTKRLQVVAPLKPLAVQKHPLTENAKHWCTAWNLVFHQYLFRSHQDGGFFYKTMHLVGQVGGTRMLGVWTALVLLMCVHVRLDRMRC